MSTKKDSAFQSISDKLDKVLEVQEAQDVKVKLTFPISNFHVGILYLRSAYLFSTLCFLSHISIDLRDGDLTYGTDHQGDQHRNVCDGPEKYWTAQATATETRQ